MCTYCITLNIFQLKFKILNHVDMLFNFTPHISCQFSLLKSEWIKICKYFTHFLCFSSFYYRFTICKYILAELNCKTLPFTNGKHILKLFKPNYIWFRIRNCFQILCCKQMLNLYTTKPKHLHKFRLLWRIMLAAYFLVTT